MSPAGAPVGTTARAGLGQHVGAGAASGLTESCQQLHATALILHLGPFFLHLKEFLFHVFISSGLVFWGRIREDYSMFQE